VRNVHDEPIRVALLQCGHIHPDLVPEHGDYPEVFADLLGPHGMDITTIDVSQHPIPEAGSFDGWLVSGSASSAYDPLPWIADLEAHLLRLLAESEPLVAVCFGHQVLAQALGSPVEKAEGGWGVGAHRYELVGAPRPWMDPPADSVRLIASHQDQVVELPTDAELLARTDHCPIAAFAVGEAAIAIQPHPEFTAAVSRGLIERRRGAIGEDRSDEALASLDGPLDRELVGRWMATVLRGDR
jgi:GMP synthase-like glutamine amidotransferase